MSENLSGLNLGAPIGTHTGNTKTAVSEAGEHGAGVGVSGGVSLASPGRDCHLIGRRLTL